MKRVLLLVVLATATARADGYYFTEAVGGTHVTDELSAHMSSAMRLHLGIGARRQQWAVEAWMGGDLNMSPEAGWAYGVESDQPADMFEYGLDLKRIEPISPHLEAYLRGTASGGFLEEGTYKGWGGRGLGFGAGLQLKGKVSAWGLLFWPLYFVNIGPKITGALYIDDGYDFYRLHGPHGVAMDASLTHITVGYAVGSDF